MKRNAVSINKSRGFTLIEIVVVVAVIALIVTFAATRIFGSSDRVKYKLTETQLQTLVQKISDYESDVGALPSSLQDLVRAPSNATGWLGPYSEEKGLKDSWNGNIEYRAQTGDSAFELVSLAADKKAGGEGYDKDIVVKP
jgi:general secretion pathway protein G